MKLILHIGAHRTGTTALQRLLQSHEADLAADGIRFWGPQVMRIGRLRDFVPSVARAGEDMGKVAELAPMATALHEEFALAEAEKARRILVSDENLLGAMRDNYERAELYPEARDWLIAASVLFPRAPDRIYLCLRDYADYAVSIYGHLVLRAPVPDFVPGLMAELGGARGWVAVLGDIRAVFPETPISVWRYDRRAGMVSGVAAAMLGTDRLKLRAPQPAANAGVSGEAIEAARALWRDAGGRRPSEIRADAEKLRTLAGKPFDPFSGEQRRNMAARFEADWRAINSGGVPGVDVFDPLMAEDAA